MLSHLWAEEQLDGCSSEQKKHRKDEGLVAILDCRLQNCFSVELRKKLVRGNIQMHVVCNLVKRSILSIIVREKGMNGLSKTEASDPWKEDKTLNLQTRWPEAKLMSWTAVSAFLFSDTSFVMETEGVRLFQPPDEGLKNIDQKVGLLSSITSHPMLHLLASLPCWLLKSYWKLDLYGYASVSCQLQTVFCLTASDGYKLHFTYCGMSNF